MQTHWRVMLNSKLWNQSKYEMQFAEFPEARRIAQSKGKCRMVKCPKKGDAVSFVLKGKVVMRGFVDSSGFEFGTNHQEHSCNIGKHRLHAEPQEFAWVQIEQVGLSENIRCTGQRTWAIMPLQ